jgi:hypothetical protein
MYDSSFLIAYYSQFITGGYGIQDDPLFFMGFFVYVPPKGLCRDCGLGGSEGFLHMKPVVGFAAVQTQLFTACQTDPFGAGGLAAAVAYIGFKELGPLGNRYHRLLSIEHLLIPAAMIIFKGFVPGHIIRLWLED